MGKIAKILAQCKLVERDNHNSRVFVDASENVHLHYREYRFVFSVEEFLAVAKAMREGEENLRKLIKEKQYHEPNDKFDGIIIGGSQTGFLPIENPKKSAYFDDRLQIERQEEGYGDVIHLHYRDSRLVMRKWENWKRFCETVWQAFKNSKKEDFKE